MHRGAFRAAEIEKCLVDRHSSTRGVSRGASARTARPTSLYFAMSGRMTSPSGQAASAFNVGMADRDTHRVAPLSSGRARCHACLHRRYRASGKIGTPAFFDRDAEGIAIDVGDRQCVKRGMTDLARRAASVASVTLDRRRSTDAAIAAQGGHSTSSARHSQAAPRTPLESP